MKRKRLNCHRVNPLPIITTTGELFKSNVNKPGLKNFILVIIAIVLCPKFRINEISRHLGVDVKTEKTKQKRLLRFLDLDRKSEKKRVMGRWATFVLEVVYRQSGKVVPILIDETDLIGSFKAIVAAVPFRQISKNLPVRTIQFSGF